MPIADAAFLPFSVAGERSMLPVMQNLESVPSDVFSWLPM